MKSRLACSSCTAALLQNGLGKSPKVDVSILVVFLMIINIPGHSCQHPSKAAASENIWKYVKISAMTTCRPQKSTFLSLSRFILFFHPRLVRSFQQGQAAHVYKMHLLQQPVTWTASKISLYQIIKTKNVHERSWTWHNMTTCDNIGYWWISYDNRQQMMTAPAFPWGMSCVTLGVPILLNTRMKINISSSTG